MITKGFKFDCPQAQYLVNIYDSNKSKYEKQKEIFNSFKDDQVKDITFTQMNKISKELQMIKMNFETDEVIFKKELWTLKCKKLVCDFDLQIKYTDKEELKQEAGNRILSDYINVLFDEGSAFGLVNYVGKKKKKAAVKEMSESKKD